MTSPNQQEIQIGDSSQDCSEWLISIMNADGDNTISHLQMGKVPKRLRDQMQAAGQKWYDPEVVSIGPYHHGEPDLRLFEERKVHFARAYLNSCKGKSINDVYNEVANVACEAKKCYEEASVKNYDKATFTRMMFLDGCFVLQFAFQYGGQEREQQGIDIKSYEAAQKGKGKQDGTHMKSHDIALAQRDLFLLENQLPFKVLEKLMSLRFGNDSDKGLKMIQKLVRETRPPEPSFWEIVEKFISEHITDRNCRNDVYGPTKSNKERPPPHLLELWRRQLVNPMAFMKLGGNNCWYTYRSVQELKLSGIHFRPNRDQPTSFTDVRYENQKIRSILRLPPMTIDDTTESLLLNLVAHEICPSGPIDLGVTSYLCFLDTLIDNAEDVKELRKMGILHNYLGSDELVAKLFNGISQNLVAKPQAFDDVKGKIERHYKNTLRLWVTEWINTHFASPWSFAAFLGIIVAIIFSFIQAYKALYPS